jgi:hypothetical protein
MTVLPATVNPRSRADDVVPVADSQVLARNSDSAVGTRIEVRSGHWMADPEPLRKMLEACGHL